MPAAEIPPDRAGSSATSSGSGCWGAPGSSGVSRLSPPLAARSCVGLQRTQKQRARRSWSGAFQVCPWWFSKHHKALEGFKMRKELILCKYFIKAVWPASISMHCLVSPFKSHRYENTAVFPAERCICYCNIHSL